MLFFFSKVPVRNKFIGEITVDALTSFFLFFTDSRLVAVINVQRVDHKKRCYSSRVFAAVGFFCSFLATVMIDKIHIFTPDRKVLTEYVSSTTSSVTSLFILTGVYVRKNHSECFSLL